MPRLPLILMTACLLSNFASAQDEASKPSVAMIEISGTPANAPGPLDWLMPPEAPTLPQLIDGLHEIANSKRYQAIVIRLKDAALTETQIQELSAPLAAIRGAGTKVFVFGEALGTSDLMFAAHADEVICQAGGDIQLTGLATEEMYLADMFEWVGLKADMIQVGAYKGANEQMVNSQPSPEWDENINGLLDSMYSNIREPILAGRKLTNAALDKAMEDLWMGQAEDALRAGLIDHAIDFTALTAHVREDLGQAFDWEFDAIPTGDAVAPDFSNPFGAIGALMREPDVEPEGETIAILHVDGAIVDGDSSVGGFSGEPTVGSRTLRNAMEDILAEPLIKGVIVRIDSPGGSATASEVMWQGLRRLSGKKPVWVSVGSMAASGGYYLAVGGDRIYVNPSSIVGSIGVVGGKISMDGLYSKLKVNIVTRTRGPRSDMFSSMPWNDAQRELVRDQMTRTYEKFTARVKAGRKGVDIEKIAAGRLFTGNRAIENGMADRIGGLDVAMDDMAKELGLSDFKIMHYPAPRSLPDVISDMLGGTIASAPDVASNNAVNRSVAATGERLLGVRTWKQIARQLDGMSQLREETVILMSPKAVIVK